MKNLALSLLALLAALVPAAGLAQSLPYPPPAVAAYINAGSGWNAWTSAAGFGALAGTPTPIALYCQASAGAAWTPCNPSGGGGSGTVTSIATTGPITGGPITTTGTIGCATCGVTGSPLSQFSSTTSAQLAGVLSDETGTGNAVFATSPTLITPALGTPSALVLTNATGLPNASVIGLGTAALVNTGTSGATVATLSGVNNTWSSINNFNAGLSATTYATNTNCTSSASPAVCASAVVGAVVIAAGATSVTVNTTKAFTASRIFVTADQSVTIPSTTCNTTAATLASPLYISARVNTTSFTISTLATISINPLCISYFIID